jgi:hypothetical protein
MKNTVLDSVLEMACQTVFSWPECDIIPMTRAEA